MILGVIAFLAGSANVTLSLPAATLKDALAEVSKQLPAPIYVEGKLATEVLCLHVQDMPLAELETTLAKVSTGEWVVRDGKKILTLPPALDKRQYQHSFEERKQAIAQALAKLESPKEITRTELSRLVAQVDEATADMINSGEANYAQYEKARDRQYNLLKGSPAERLLARIVQRFTATQLTNLDPSIRTCFSNTPNPVQRAFPFKITDLLSMFNREQTMLKQLLPAGQPSYSTKIEDRRRYIYEASPDCSELLLIVDESRNSGLPVFKLFIGDTDLKVHSLVLTSLIRTNPKVTPETSLPDFEIELSPHQQALSHALLFMRSSALIDPKTGKPIRELIAPSLEWLSQPLQHEPLADLVGPTLISTAKQAGKDLVALVPDAALSWVPAGEKVRSSDLGTRMVSQVNDYNSKTWDALVDNGDKLITVTPRMPSRWRDQRINRNALDRLFGSTLKQGSLSVLEAAVYINTCGTSTAFETGSYDTRASGFAETMRGTYSSEEKSTWYHRDLLQLLGSMPEQALRAFLTGGEAGLSQLGRKNVERFFFGRNQIFDLFLDPSLHWRDRRFEDRKLSDEVWEKLPNGIPSTFKIVCQPSEETLILVESSSVKDISVHTPEEFGRNLAEMDRYYENPIFRTGKAIKYDFQILISPALTGRTELGDIASGRRSSFKDISELPNDVRQKIARGVEADKRRKAAEGQSGGVGPPPP